MKNYTIEKAFGLVQGERKNVRSGAWKRCANEPPSLLGFYVKLSVSRR